VELVQVVQNLTPVPNVPGFQTFQGTAVQIKDRFGGSFHDSGIVETSKGILVSLLASESKSKAPIGKDHSAKQTGNLKRRRCSDSEACSAGGTK